MNRIDYFTHSIIMYFSWLYKKLGINFKILFIEIETSPKLSEKEN